MPDPSKENTNRFALSNEMNQSSLTHTRLISQNKTDQTKPIMHCKKKKTRQQHLQYRKNKSEPNKSEVALESLLLHNPDW